MSSFDQASVSDRPSVKPAINPAHFASMRSDTQQPTNSSVGEHFAPASAFGPDLAGNRRSAEQSGDGVSQEGMGRDAGVIVTAGQPMELTASEKKLEASLLDLSSDYSNKIRQFGVAGGHDQNHDGARPISPTEQKAFAELLRSFVAVRGFVDNANQNSITRVLPDLNYQEKQSGSPWRLTRDSEGRLIMADSKGHFLSTLDTLHDRR